MPPLKKIYELWIVIMFMTAEGYSKNFKGRWEKCCLTGVIFHLLLLGKQQGLAGNIGSHYRRRWDALPCMSIGWEENALDECVQCADVADLTMLATLMAGNFLIVLFPGRIISGSYYCCYYHAVTRTITLFSSITLASLSSISISAQMLMEDLE